MASILDKYGIKEVADVVFYDLDSNGNPTVPVLYLDTLKVSTIEQTAEEATAMGGKGNAPLIVWDYGKEITVTLEDALFSAKSMAIMFGDGRVRGVGATNKIMKTESFVVTAAGKTTDNIKEGGWLENVIINGKSYAKADPVFFDTNGKKVTPPSKTEPQTPGDNFTVGATYFCTYNLNPTDTSGVIEISANTFPGTYYVTGDTYARSQNSGKDEFFQFIIPKGKVQSENTITLEADGDPSVFNMNLKVLRPKDGVMMKLVKYDLEDGTDAEITTSKLVDATDLA